MPVNFSICANHLLQLQNSLVVGMGLSTYLKPCFFIYDQDVETGLIKIDDQSTLIAPYDILTDVHEIFVTIRKETCGECDELCYTGPFVPFGNLSFQLPGYGKYTVEIDVRYTILYDAGEAGIIPYTFQAVFVYPVEWVASGSYHNNLIADIKCRIAQAQCQIGKSMKVGRIRGELQPRVFMLVNYLYALCNFDLTLDEIDAISCKVKTIKKTC